MNQKLIIELGCPYREIVKAINFNLENIVGVLISHAHS
jgi:hypothetical protein